MLITNLGLEHIAANTINGILELCLGRNERSYVPTVTQTEMKSTEVVRLISYQGFTFTQQSFFVLPTAVESTVANEMGLFLNNELICIGYQDFDTTISQNNIFILKQTEGQHPSLVLNMDNVEDVLSNTVVVRSAGKPLLIQFTALRYAVLKDAIYRASQVGATQLDAICVGFSYDQFRNYLRHLHVECNFDVRVSIPALFDKVNHNDHKFTISWDK